MRTGFMTRRSASGSTPANTARPCCRHMTLPWRCIASLARCGVHASLHARVCACVRFFLSLPPPSPSLSPSLASLSVSLLSTRARGAERATVVTRSRVQPAIHALVDNRDTELVPTSQTHSVLVYVPCLGKLVSPNLVCVPHVPRARTRMHARLPTSICVRMMCES